MWVSASYSDPSCASSPESSASAMDMIQRSSRAATTSFCRPPAPPITRHDLGSRRGLRNHNTSSSPAPCRRASMPASTLVMSALVATGHSVSRIATGDMKKGFRLAVLHNFLSVQNHL